MQLQCSPEEREETFSATAPPPAGCSGQLDRIEPLSFYLYCILLLAFIPHPLLYGPRAARATILTAVLQGMPGGLPLNWRWGLWLQGRDLPKATKCLHGRGQSSDWTIQVRSPWDEHFMRSLRGLF